LFAFIPRLKSWAFPLTNRKYRFFADEDIRNFCHKKVRVFVAKSSTDFYIQLMRMWMINPKFLCKNHLMGEHFEIHKHRHIFLKKYSIAKRISPIVQIEPASMKKRHDELVREIIRRKYNHNSPYEMPDISYLTEAQMNAKVDLDYSLKDLNNRCPECKKLISKNIRFI